jgi:hypothetical protein
MVNGKKSSSLEPIKPLGKKWKKHNKMKQYKSFDKKTLISNEQQSSN